jgi:hypothetical protein
LSVTIRAKDTEYTKDNVMGSDRVTVPWKYVLFHELTKPFPLQKNRLLIAVRMTYVLSKIHPIRPMKKFHALIIELLIIFLCLQSEENW